MIGTFAQNCSNSNLTMRVAPSDKAKLADSALGSGRKRTGKDPGGVGEEESGFGDKT